MTEKRNKPQNKEKWNRMAEDMISRKFYRWEAERHITTYCADQGT